MGQQATVVLMEQVGLAGAVRQWETTMRAPESETAAASAEVGGWERAAKETRTATVRRREEEWRQRLRN